MHESVYQGDFSADGAFIFEISSLALHEVRMRAGHVDTYHKRPLVYCVVGSPMPLFARVIEAGKVVDLILAPILTPSFSPSNSSQAISKRVELGIK